MWTLGELAVPHEHIDAGGSFGGLDTDEFRSEESQCARHGDRRRRHRGADRSRTAIVRYVAAKYGAGTLWHRATRLAPRRLPIAAMSDMWTRLDPRRSTARFPRRRVLEFLPHAGGPQRNWPAIRQGIARSAILFRLLDRHLADKPFIAGETLTIRRHCCGRAALSLFRARNRPSRSLHRTSRRGMSV